MLNLLVFWGLSALILFIVANIAPGVAIDNIGTAFIASLVLGLVNAVIRPILIMLTLPLNLITFGLFSFVINAGMFGLVAALVPGFAVSNFWTALLGSLLLSIAGSFVHQTIGDTRNRLTS